MKISWMLPSIIHSSFSIIKWLFDISSIEHKEAVYVAIVEGTENNG